MKTELLSLRISQDMKTKLELIAKSTGRSKSFIVLQALDKYCDFMLYQTSAVNNAIQQADNNEMLAQDDIRQEWTL